MKNQSKELSLCCFKFLFLFFFYNFVLELDIGTDVIIDMKGAQTFLKAPKNEKYDFISSSSLYDMLDLFSP